MLTFMIDHGAYVLVEDFAQSSYAPWARFAKKVLEEETGHMDFGNDFIRRQVDKIGKAQVQHALNLWWRLALNMFGPPVTGNTNIIFVSDLNTEPTRSVVWHFGLAVKRESTP
jgi:1,2-phenylacetyl-CoA epoxidase catalytic subunit